MKKLIILALAITNLTACGFDVDVDIPDSTQTIKHVVTVELPQELVALCEKIEDPAAYEECITQVSEDFNSLLQGIIDAFNQQQQP